jgi:hypothetical protein
MKKTGALVAAAALLLSACAGGSDANSEDPKAALVTAMENTGASEGLTFTLSIESDPESLNALDRAGSTSEGIAEEDAEKILASSLTMSTRGSGEEGAFEMVVNVAGEHDIEVKAIDKVLYFRADVEGLVETFGGDPSEIETGVQQAEAQGLTFVRPAAEGEWVSISGLGDSLGQITGQTPPPVPEQEELIQDLTASIKENATVTSKGQEDAGEHLVVSLPLRETYENFVEDFSQLSQQIPLGQLPDSSTVPEEDVTLDIWVDDDRVTQVLLDIVQVAELAEDADVPEGTEVSFLAEIEEFEDDIEAPEDAVAIDPQQILGIFGGLLGGMGAPGAGGGAAPPAGDLGAGFNCDDLAGAPPEVLSEFAEECPELQP